MSLKVRAILKPMPTLDLDGVGVRRELEEVLKSPGFVRNERMSRFLAFVIERHLQGRDHELKESVIGTEVFGRKPDYSPKCDPIVRTEARRLRERLAEYYQGVGANSRVRIELPKGGYVPVVVGIENLPEVSTASLEGARPTQRKWLVLGSVACVSGVLLVVAGLMWFGPTLRLRRLRSSPAYDLYLRARAFEAQPGLSGIESSLDLFQQAIIKDPAFAPAYAGVAAALAARSGFDRFEPAQRAEMIGKARAAAARALKLAPQSADAHDALAMVQAREAQWEPAERSFRRAIELDPRDLLCRDHFALFLLLPLGRVDEAIRQLRSAEELDPLSAEVHSGLSLALRSTNHSDEALFHCQKAAANDQQRSACWAEILQRQGKSEEAVRILEASWTGHLLEPGGHVLGIAYAKAGRRDDAERIARMLPRLASKAQIFAALQDSDRTLDALDQMAPMGPVRIGRDFLLFPNFKFLRGDPRLTALRKKVGLPQ